MGEDGEKKIIEEMKDTYIDEWKKKIYQKTERIDFSFWYGTDGLKGKKEEMEEKEKGDMEIMKLPRMEEDMVNIIREMKNGKAVGIDGIRAELIKHIVKNDTIRQRMVKCCNRV